MATKRTLDAFFQPSPAKKPRIAPDNSPASTDLPVHESNDPEPNPTSDLLTPSPLAPSTHPAYAFPIPQLPPALSSALSTSVPGHAGKPITDAPDLDLLSFRPFIPRAAADALFTFLRRSLPFYRVKYSIRRGATETEINTPRFTHVFGIDATSYFCPSSSSSSSSFSLSAAILDSQTHEPVPPAKYACRPRPIPPCLDLLRRLAEALTGAEYNFVLVNYYASGQDSIGYHSDDEKFLGHEPTIASLSLGSTRDFLMRHKPLARDAGKDATAGIYGNRGTVGRDRKAGGADWEGEGEAGLTAEEEAVREAHKNPLKLPMAGGDMVLMRGRSQSHWLHSVPKRAGKGGEGGRINITFRKALVKGGTENYYQYNVGRGPAMRWDEKAKEMREWKMEDGKRIEETGGEKGEGDAVADVVKEKARGNEAWTRTSTKYGIPFERKWHDK